jgi:hypothetical protein
MKLQTKLYHTIVLGHGLVLRVLSSLPDHLKPFVKHVKHSAMKSFEEIKEQFDNGEQR